jgi:hypothetical protein
MPTQYKTRILLRTDTSSNWTSMNPTLKLGEMGFAIDNGVVIGGKVGMDKTWNSTPFHFTAFQPIVTNYGRNLDEGKNGPPHSTQHNFQTESEAWEYVLYPYSPPSIVMTGYEGGIIWDSEVGDTFNNYAPIGQAGSYPFDFTIYNTPSLFIEKVAGVDKKVYYVSTPTVPVTPLEIIGGAATKYTLSDQTGINAYQVHNSPINANSNVTGKLNVFTALVRGKKDPTNVNSVYQQSAYVRFRIRSTAFLYRSNAELLHPGTYSDAQLSSIVRSMQGDVAGVKYSNMADYGGTKVFNYGNAITWNTVALEDTRPIPPSAAGHGGFFYLYVAAPISAGLPIIYNSSSDPSNAEPLVIRNFIYSNGTATGDPATGGKGIPYGLYQVPKLLTGTYTVKMI